DGFRDLILRAQAGDRRAMDEALEAVRPELQARAGRFAAPDRPEASASDLVQEVCLRAWEKLGQFTGEGTDQRTRSAVRGWVLSLLDSQGLTAVRHRNAQRRSPPGAVLRLAPADASDGLEPPADQPTPSARAGAFEEADLLRAALDRLPEGDRDIVRLRFF